MNRNFAFRLCGELSKTGANLYYGVSTGNLAMTCINAGIELIDMTSSIISWGSEHNRTKVMQATLDETLEKQERLKETERDRADSIVKMEQEKSQCRLNKLKIELEKDRHVLLEKLEQMTAESNSEMDLYLRRSELTARIRLRVKDTIDLVTSLIENQTLSGSSDSPILAELQERLRISVAQYTKFVSTCC